MSAPVRVIANPQAAGGRAGRILPELVEGLRGAGIEHSLHRTRAAGHARDLALAARETSGSILVVGGDGTIHEVASGLLAGTSPRSPGPPLPPLAVLPVGTGNDFFRMIHSPPGIPGVIRTLKEGLPRTFEVGFARWNGGVGHFVNVVGVGIDVEVLRRRASFNALTGLPQYLAALAMALASYRPVRVRVSDGSGSNAPVTSADRGVLLAAVTVGPSIGGGFLLSPRARPHDGLLDLFVAESLGIAKVLRYLPGILRGTLEEAPGLCRRQITQIEISHLDGKPFPFELDGELMPDGTSSLEVEVQVGGLRVLELLVGGKA